METKYVFNSAAYDARVSRCAEEAARHFRRLTRNYALFHAGFFLLGLIELLALLLFFPFFSQSSLSAFSLAAVFLTGFSYFVLRFYFQVRKPEELVHLRSQFIQTCEEAFQDKLDPSHRASLLCHAVYRLLSYLEGQEYHYYRLPNYFAALAPLTEKFSLWRHGQDLFQIKELLHQLCIQQQIERVKHQPTDLETHAALAGSYIALYKLYIDPRKLGKKVPYPFILRTYGSEEMKKKFLATAERAIEEFKILDTYSPNDPWVHAQLAAIYHDLGQLDKEIAAYETLLKISPQERELAFRLGVLYFQQGLTAAGLKIYEQLKRAQDPKADTLIGFYDPLEFR